ncbi:MlaD family protein [Nocardia bovistercoris]|uniref:MCE family protein n=1 Tax=Nocardia bovistercoris TaxID=2785916 RepID=A0A931I6I4_9NOCA|nr:MlaD family protein [Nocardia bovistercoris]MBH0775509.1 MCE family protein [Nocardia bovistercoris]
MKASSIASLGGIAAVSLLGSAYLTFGVVGTDRFTEFTSATMTLSDASGLVEGSPVLLTGVEVGDVTAVEHIGTGVEVRFRVDDAHRVPIDSDVSIESLSALGEPYIEFAPRTEDGPYLTDGQRLDTERVRVPMSIPTVSRMLTAVFDQLDPETLRALVDTFGTAVEGTESVIPELARSTELLAAAMNVRMPAIGATIDDVQTLAADSAWVPQAAPHAASAFVQFGERVEEVAQALDRLFSPANPPQMYVEEDGLVPFFTRLTDWSREVGPDFRLLAPALQPLADEAAGALPRIDLSRMISAALHGVGDDGAGRVHIRIK